MHQACVLTKTGTEPCASERAWHNIEQRATSISKSSGSPKLASRALWDIESQTRAGAGSKTLSERIIMAAMNSYRSATSKRSRLCPTTICTYELSIYYRLKLQSTMATVAVAKVQATFKDIELAARRVYEMLGRHHETSLESRANVYRWGPR